MHPRLAALDRCRNTGAGLALLLGLLLPGLLLPGRLQARPFVKPPAAQGRPGQAVHFDDGAKAALEPWFKALRRAIRHKGHARIAFFGASHTAADLWTGQLRRLLQSRFGDAGHGFVFPARWNIGYRHQDVVVDSSKGWVVDRYKQSDAEPVRDLGLAGLVMTSADPNDFAWVRTTRDNPHGRRASLLELWYRSAPDGGDLLVDIDGKRHVVGTRGAEPGLHKQVWRLRDAGHAVRLAPAGNGPVALYGLALERRGHGIILDQLGIPGMRAEVQLHWQEDTWRKMLRDRKPDLVVYAYGTNSLTDDAEPIEVYVETWRKVIERLRAARPEAACLLIGPTDRLVKDADGIGRTLPRTPAVIAAHQRVAAELGCGHWDAVAAMGGPGSMLEWQKAGLASRDDVHLTRRGYPWLAELLNYALLRDYAAPKRTAARAKAATARVRTTSR